MTARRWLGVLSIAPTLLLSHVAGAQRVEHTQATARATGAAQATQAVQATKAAKAVQKAPVPRPPDAATIAKALRRYRHEPSVAQLVAEAKRAAGAGPGAMVSMQARARAAGWIPRVQMTVRRGQAIDLSATAAQDGALRTSTDDDLMLQGVLSFDLPRLLFSRAEVSIAGEQRARAEDRRALMREVVALYFERRRLQLQRDLVGDADLSLHARLIELEALLDVFTNGALSRMMGAR